MYSFCGCSITYGTGVKKNENYPSILKGINYAIPGSSNTAIFYQALTALNDSNRIIFVQWSAPGRSFFKINGYTGVFFPTQGTQVFDLLKHIINKKDLDTFNVISRLLDCDFNQYYCLSTYFKILNDLAKKFNKQIYFLNGLLHIDTIFFEKSVPKNLHKLNKTTRSIIEFEDQPDEVITHSIQTIQEYFSHTSTDQWVDINRIERLDKGSDNMHPGPQSHRLVATKITNFLQEKDSCKNERKII